MKLSITLFAALFACLCLAASTKSCETCMTNAQCAGDEYCGKADGDCFGLGSCETKPELCLHVWLPVCGCDDITYSNDCYAAAAGVSVAHDGECDAVDPEEQACLDSGGTVGTASCCLSAEDFPNTCLIGACGCGPNASHEVKVCDCPEGSCFDGEKCALAEH